MINETVAGKLATVEVMVSYYRPFHSPSSARVPPAAILARLGPPSTSIRGRWPCTPVTFWSHRWFSTKRFSSLHVRHSFNPPVRTDLRTVIGSSFGLSPRRLRSAFLHPLPAHLWIRALFRTARLKLTFRSTLHLFPFTVFLCPPQISSNLTCPLSRTYIQVSGIERNTSFPLPDMLGPVSLTIS